MFPYPDDNRALFDIAQGSAVPNKRKADETESAYTKGTLKRAVVGDL